MSTIEMTSRKKIKEKKERKKHNWVAVVHKACRVGVFRTLEVVAIFVFVTTISMVIGSSLLPLLSFTVANGTSITQSTDFYTACATWLIPMLFYTLLAVSGTFFLQYKFIRWIHRKMTRVIESKDIIENKGEV